MTPLWIGGAPGCGKSTVARTLARRHGLRWYNADTRTWAHRDAALRAGDPDAELFERLDPAERWRRPVPELLRMSLHHVRGPMTATEVRALPAPITLAEGTTVTPAVTGTDPAVWLLASRATRTDRLSGRGLNPGQLALYLELGEVIAAEAAAARVPVLTVDDLGPAKSSPPWNGSSPRGWPWDPPPAPPPNGGNWPARPIWRSSNSAAASPGGPGHRSHSPR